MADYAVEFRTLAAEGGWKDAPFYQGMSELIKDESSSHDDLPELDSLVAVASRLVRRFRERQREQTF